MVWKSYRNILILLLLVSVIIRIVILVFDGLLWFDNPKNGHATALVVFTVIDLILVGFVITRVERGFISTAVYGFFQFIIMLANPLTGPAIGISPTDFAAYLFGISTISGPTIMVDNSSVACPFDCPPFRYSYPILMIVQLFIGFLAFMGRRALSRNNKVGEIATN